MLISKTENRVGEQQTLSRNKVSWVFILCFPVVFSRICVQIVIPMNSIESAEERRKKRQTPSHGAGDRDQFVQPTEGSFCNLGRRQPPVLKSTEKQLGR